MKIIMKHRNRIFYVVFFVCATHPRRSFQNLSVWHRKKFARSDNPSEPCRVYVIFLIYMQISKFVIYCCELHTLHTRIHSWKLGKWDFYGPWVIEMLTSYWYIYYIASERINNFFYKWLNLVEHDHKNHFWENICRLVFGSIWRNYFEC